MKEEFEIFELDHFGRGITRYNKKIVFIENAMDTEVVEAKITRNKKNFSEGETLKVLKESTDRWKPACPYYNNCGGCNIMHMKYTKQLDFKIKETKKILEKFAGISPSLIKEIIPSNDFSYRNKVTLKIKEKLGFFKKKTYELVEIDECLICSEDINRVIKELNQLKLDKISEVIIRSNYKNETMVIFKITEDIDEDYYKKHLEKITENFIIVKDGISRTIFGDGYITEKLGDYYFKISPLSFFQVNTNQALKLYNVIKKYADLNKNENVLDLYCGTGTIGIFLSNLAGHVTGIEINQDAVNDAIENKNLNGIINIDFVRKDIRRVIDKYKDIDVVIVDPPRSGLGYKAIKNITEINSKKIIYTSCDSATLARDLNILKNNYRVEEITLVDMFPNTHHVESVILLQRKD